MARDGEVLLAASTTAQGDCADLLEPRSAVPVKGFAEPVALSNLQDEAALA